jgi:hypothetical protein
MTPVGGIRGSSVAATGRAARDETPSRHEARTESGRALIAREPIAPGDTPLRTRPQASYLAHLIATRDKLPQTRERRRAEPQDVIAAYAAAEDGPAAPSGQTLVRIL